VKAALKASDQHIVTVVSATWIMATLPVVAKKRWRTFGTVARLPSGRYEARYFYQGIFHNAPENYRTVADANAWLTVEKFKILPGTWALVTGPAMTVAALADKWLASSSLKRNSSRSRDASTVRHYIRRWPLKAAAVEVVRPGCQVAWWNLTCGYHSRATLRGSPPPSNSLALAPKADNRPASQP
jgi:hypothetical protein